MKKLGLYFLWLIVHYCVVVGIGWTFVLGAEFQFWKLLTTAILSSILNTIMLIFFGEKKNEPRKTR